MKYLFNFNYLETIRHFLILEQSFSFPFRIRDSEKSANISVGGNKLKSRFFVNSWRRMDHMVLVVQLLGVVRRRDQVQGSSVRRSCSRRPGMRRCRSGKSRLQHSSLSGYLIWSVLYCIIIGWRGGLREVAASPENLLIFFYLIPLKLWKIIQMFCFFGKKVSRYYFIYFIQFDSWWWMESVVRLEHVLV